MGSCVSTAESGEGDGTPLGQGRERIEVDALACTATRALEDTVQPLKIRIRSRQRSHLPGPESYPLVSRTKGTALIINNANDDCKRGAGVDVKNLHQLLKKINFKVKICNHFKAHEVKRSIEKFAKNCKIKDNDLCVVVIIGNVKSTPSGKKLTEIGGDDGKFLPTLDIIERFSDDNCPQLKGKPKVFLFHGHLYGESTLDEPDFSQRLPCKDMFIANVLLQGTMKPQTISSYYIQALCRTFMDHAYENDLETMIKTVENQVYNHDRSTQHTYYDNLHFKRCYIYAS